MSLYYKVCRIQFYTCTVIFLSKNFFDTNNRIKRTLKLMCEYACYLKTYKTGLKILKTILIVLNRTRVADICKNHILFDMDDLS